MYIVKYYVNRLQTEIFEHYYKCLKCNFKTMML